jgi:hypothetical protein
MEHALKKKPSMFHPKKNAKHKVLFHPMLPALYFALPLRTMTGVWTVFFEVDRCIGELPGTHNAPLNNCLVPRRASGGACCTSPVKVGQVASASKSNFNATSLA